MKVTLTGRTLLMVRTESDPAAVPQPYPRPPRLTKTEYNSWRKDYYMSFDTEEEAKQALDKVTQLNDFAKAAAWLDKQ